MYILKSLYQPVGIMYFILLYIIVFSVNAKEIFVSVESKSFFENGSIDSPLTSISSAISRADPGDVIRLLPGIYYTNIEFMSGGKKDNPIILKSHNGLGSVVIDCINQTRKNCIDITHKYITIEGLEVRNVHYNGIKVDGDINGTQSEEAYGNYGRYYERNRYVNGSGNIVIKNNYIHDVKYDGIKIGHINNIIIENNIIYRTGKEGRQSGIDMVGVYNALVKGNYVFDDLDSPSMDVGMFCKGGCENIVFEGNYISNIVSPFAAIEIGGDTEWHNTRYTKKNFNVDINSILLDRNSNDSDNFINNTSSYSPEKMAEARNVIVRNNLVVNSDPPISLRNAYNVMIYNNSVYESGWSQGWIKLWSDGNKNHVCENITITRNLFYNNKSKLSAGKIIKDKHEGTIFKQNTDGIKIMDNLFWLSGGDFARNPKISPNNMYFKPEVSEGYQIKSDKGFVITDRYLNTNDLINVIHNNIGYKDKLESDYIGSKISSKDFSRYTFDYGK